MKQYIAMPLFLLTAGLLMVIAQSSGAQIPEYKDWLTESGAVHTQASVGIGTTQPTTKLEVQGQNIRLLSGGAGSFASYQLGRTFGDLEIGVAGFAGNFFTSTVAGDIAVRTSTGKLMLGANTGDATVTLLTSGDVGIGTTNPSARLNVESPLNNIGAFEISSGTNNCYLYVSSVAQACSAGGAAVVTGATSVLCATCN